MVNYKRNTFLFLAVCVLYKELRGLDLFCCSKLLTKLSNCVIHDRSSIRLLRNFMTVFPVKKISSIGVMFTSDQLIMLYAVFKLSLNTQNFPSSLFFIQFLVTPNVRHMSIYLLLTLIGGFMSEEDIAFLLKGTLWQL